MAIDLTNSIYVLDPKLNHGYIRWSALSISCLECVIDWSSKSVKFRQNWIIAQDVLWLLFSKGYVIFATKKFALDFLESRSETEYLV